jgi:L-ascorbate oxidase
MRLTFAIIALLGALAHADQASAYQGPRRPPNGKTHRPYGPPSQHDATFVPDHILRVSYSSIPIACQTRESVLVNGTSPGPELRLAPGKTSWIRVYNDMTDYNFTMHWHGLSQRTAIFSDGTPQASQWPIAPLHFFDYEVHSEPDDAGSYFYHSHVGFQAGSAYGPLIVEDDGPPPYAYDVERIVQFADYFNRSDTSIEAGLTASSFVWSGETNAVLLNGVGVAIGEEAGSGECRLPTINVEAGKTYRWRFIGSTALSMVQFGIVDHANLTIVAADGRYTKPYAESFIQVASGQRFDVIFKAKSEEELNGQTEFVIQYETKDRPAVYRGYATLQYSSAKPTITTGPVSPPITFSKATYDWLEYRLEPLVPNDFPSADEVTRRVEIHVQQLMGNTIMWQENGLQWNTSTPPADVPYLVNIYKNGQAAMPDYDAALKNGGWDPKTYTWPAKLGEVSSSRLACAHVPPNTTLNTLHRHGECPSTTKVLIMK